MYQRYQKYKTKMLQKYTNTSRTAVSGAVHCWVYYGLN